MKTAVFSLSMVLFVGCVSHSTSDYRSADYSSRRARGHSGNELSDKDVVGATLEKTPSDQEIANALDLATGVQVKYGDSIMVVQSGQPVPDARMVAEVNKHYRAIPYSGIRSDWARSNPENQDDHYSKSLRMAAAQAGAQKILCYWGNLEVARHNLSTKTITWLPVIDVIIPDQKDSVRVHLKLALVDVRTGAWSFFRTEPVQAQVITTGWAREHLEIPEVKELQQKSYVVAVNTLASVRQ